MLFNDQVQVTVMEVDHDRDWVKICWHDPTTGEVTEREMSLKEFVKIINMDPNSKIQQPVVN